MRQAYCALPSFVERELCLGLERAVAGNRRSLQRATSTGKGKGKGKGKGGGKGGGSGSKRGGGKGKGSGPRGAAALWQPETLGTLRKWYCRYGARPQQRAPLVRCMPSPLEPLPPLQPAALVLPLRARPRCAHCSRGAVGARARESGAVSTTKSGRGSSPGSRRYGSSFARSKKSWRAPRARQTPSVPPPSSAEKRRTGRMGASLSTRGETAHCAAPRSSRSCFCFYQLASASAGSCGSASVRQRGDRPSPRASRTHSKGSRGGRHPLPGTSYTGRYTGRDHVAVALSA